jgi:hypothetical protein
MQDNLAPAFAESLERERQLGRTYRQELQAAWSPRVRRLWEEGWTIKRGHEEALIRLLGAIGKARTEDAKAPAPTPSAREVLSWLYGEERSLAIAYREFASMATDADTQRTLNRLADEQRRLVERVRDTYRDYSVA